MNLFAVKYFYCCLLFYGALLHFLRFMLFNFNSFNYMLLWFFPLALILGFHNVCFMFGYPQCLGLPRRYDQWPIHFCKALSWKSLWINVSAKRIHVTHKSMQERLQIIDHLKLLYLSTLYSLRSNTVNRTWYHIVGLDQFDSPHKLNCARDHK